LQRQQAKVVSNVLLILLCCSLRIESLRSFRKKCVGLSLPNPLTLSVKIWCPGLVKRNYGQLAHIDVATRGNKHTLYQSSVNYDLRKHFFTNRVVSLWNTLPNVVVDSDSINCFKSRLDTF